MLCTTDLSTKKIIKIILGGVTGTLVPTKRVHLREREPRGPRRTFAQDRTSRMENVPIGRLDRAGAGGGVAPGRRRHVLSLRMRDVGGRGFV